MIVNRWKELGPELLKDFWTDSQVCHIFSGLVEITKDGRYDCIEIEQEGRTDTKKEKRDMLSKHCEPGTSMCPHGQAVVFFDGFLNLEISVLRSVSAQRQGGCLGFPNVFVFLSQKKIL